MSEAKAGDTVKVHYTGRLEDGTPFDSSRDREPLEFTLGSGQIIPGFEQAVVGMSEGDSKTVSIDSDQAYGPRIEQAVQDMPKAMLPEEIRDQLRVGMQLQATNAEGRPMVLTVAGVGDETVTLDANHPLAGQTLVFDLELVEIV
ncbi:MAG: peptidylprolyl isomerase [Pseudomonadota bacterium]|nr:peptidylprolyl isomerase [Pseudomonadota bacterium]